MIDKLTIQRILDTSRVEEVVGEFVSLKKRGANYIGCCPFHNEKTPSFYVSPSKGIYKCFGCGESGSSVNFLMKHEHYTYPEALKYLARKYNIEIQEEEISEEQRQRDSERDALFHVSEYAQKYFAQLLYEDEMGRAVGLSYFHSRGLNDEVIRKFGLGYCLDEWSNFTDKATKEGYSKEVLEKTGLTIYKDDGKSFDRFRGRVMFPIYSISGRVLGFSGRILTNDKKMAKYVNSPDSEIYNKGFTLYGLFQARNAISRQNKCYLVEGNVDVVSMFQSGVENTVASCGTSLTTDQIRLIKRYTNNVTILYDGDAAGIKASQRAVNLLYPEGMHVSLVLFPDQEDPDSYAQKYGSTQLQEYLRDHEENFILYKMRICPDDVKKDPIRKSAFVRELVETIALIPDLLERTAYITQISSLLDVPERTLTSELATIMLRNKVRASKDRNSDSTADASVVAETPSTPTPSPDAPQVSITDDLTNAQSPILFHERNIISLMVNYGADEIQLEYKVDDSKTESRKLTVAEYIIEQFTTDELSFQTPIYQRIFNYYATAPEVPTCSAFTMMEDSEIGQCAISLMQDAYELSSQWKEKHHIVVPDHKGNLSQSVQDSVNAYKLAHIDMLIEDNNHRLKSVANDQELLDLINEKKQLVTYRAIIAKQLHRIVS